MTKIQQLEHLLEYSFHDKSLPVQALTHPSYLHEISTNNSGDDSTVNVNAEL